MKRISNRFQPLSRSTAVVFRRVLLAQNEKEEGTLLEAHNHTDVDALSNVPATE